MMSLLRTFLALAARNIMRNTKRTGITLVVVAVGLWSILFFDAFLNAWIQSGKDEALGLLTGSGQIHAKGYLDDPSVDTLMDRPSGALASALAAPDISAFASRLAVPGVVQSEYKTLPITITGVDPRSETRVSTIPTRVVEGRYLEGPQDDGVILGLHMVERLNSGLGRRVILMAPGADGTLAERSFDVVGLFDADQGTEDLFAFTGIDAAADFLGVEHRISEVAIVLADDATLDQSFAALSAAAPDLDVQTWKELNFFLAATDTSMRTFIFIWLGVVFSLMAIGIINTQLMAVFERTREFGLLRALGLKPRWLLLLVVIESALLIGAGVLIGAGLAVASVLALSGGLDLSAFARALEMFQGGQVLYLQIVPANIVFFSGLIWILGIVVALWPARRASRSSPVEAMRLRT